MEARAILKDYIRQELMSGSNVALDEDQDLLAAGIVDSLGLLRLVSFVEERFGIEVADEDVTFDNFQSIKAIINYMAEQK